MFNTKAYDAWRKFMWPLVKADLQKKTDDQLLRMYEACVNQVINDYKSTFKSTLLQQQLEQMSKNCSHIGPSAVQTLLRAPVQVYLEEDARVKYQIAN